MTMIIRVIDLETTGFAPPEAKVCEVGWCDLIPRAADLLGAPVNWIEADGAGQLCDPGVPIPPETSAIHHIIDDDVRGLRTFEQLWGEINNDDAPDIFAAHSAKFERQFIDDEMTGGRPWICTYKAALRLWPDAPSHSNQALRYWRRPPGLSREIASVAHRAFPDAYVTAHLLCEMLNDGAETAQLIRWTEEPALQVRCHIGKWRGTPWREVDDGFLYWVSQRDFDEDVLFTVQHEMERRNRESVEAAS